MTGTRAVSPAARHRLRGAGVFESVFRCGVRHDAHYLQLIAAPAAQVPGRIGFVIGRKSMRRAVDRNRLRRRLREVARTARPAIERYDIVLRVRRLLPREAVMNAVIESRVLITRLLTSGVKEATTP